MQNLQPLSHHIMATQSPGLSCFSFPDFNFALCLPLFAGCLRDLQRFFRHDDPEARPAFFAVSKYNFARSDLVPLIVTYPEDYDVVYNARELVQCAT